MQFKINLEFLSRHYVPSTVFPTCGLKSVICLVHLYQQGDTIDVRGDQVQDTKNLGPPGLGQFPIWGTDVSPFWPVFLINLGVSKVKSNQFKIYRDVSEIKI